MNTTCLEMAPVRPAACPRHPAGTKARVFGSTIIGLENHTPENIDQVTPNHGPASASAKGERGGLLARHLTGVDRRR
jgi:hypothetical protein